MLNEMVNTITQGDCLEVMKRIPDGSVDMILADLPYGTTACTWDSVIPFDLLWHQYNRIIKSNGAIVLTASQPFTTALIASNINNFKHQWYWNKETGGAFAVAKYRPLSIVEDICVFTKNGERVNYYPIMEEANPRNVRPANKGSSSSSAVPVASGLAKSREGYDIRKRYPRNVLTYNGRAGELNSLNRVHPTQKPVALFEYLIRTYSNEGDIVLDNCIGSGTTAVAAINTGRYFIGIEQESEYVEIARRRADEALAIKNEKENDKLDEQ